MHQEYRVVVGQPNGGILIVGSPPYLKADTASRVKSLWRNRLLNQGLSEPDVRVQVTDVEWTDL